VSEKLQSEVDSGRRSSNGERGSARATQARQQSGTRAATRSAAAAESKLAKMQDPVPVNRVGANLANQSIASATSG
jgi:hypothetical protein